VNVSVLVKCPHDVRAEVKECQGLPTKGSPGENLFDISSVEVTFDCNVCKGYHQGYLEGQSSHTLSSTPRNIGTVPVKDQPQA
jgi:hypothetical protein